MEWDNVISICAAVVALLSAIDAHRQNYKINRINLQSGYLDQIYKEHLIYRIPESRKYIEFLHDRLSGTDQLVDELNSIRRDSLYFYFNNKKFFDKLKKKLQWLENYLMEREGKFYTPNEQKHIYITIQKRLEDIYACINDLYLREEI